MDLNIELASNLLLWSKGDCIGFTNEDAESARKLALKMLRVVADSLKPGCAEAAWLLVLNPKITACDEFGLGQYDEAEYVRYYGIAAALRHPEALESLVLDREQSPELARKVQAVIDEFNADV